MQFGYLHDMSDPGTIVEILLIIGVLCKIGEFICKLLIVESLGKKIGVPSNFFNDNFFFMQSKFDFGDYEWFNIYL